MSLFRLHACVQNASIHRVGNSTGSKPIGCRVGSRLSHTIHGSAVMTCATGVLASAEFTPSEQDKLQLGTALRNIGWLSFWSQLILSTVSGVVLLFSMGITAGGSFSATPTDICTLVGVGCGLLTSMLSWTWIRSGRKLEEMKSIKLQQCMGTVLASTNLNLLGMGATILGLQANVGTLVAKTLTSAAGGMYYNPRAAPPPVAFDVFSVQSCTNTIMAHFVGLVLAQWLLRILRRFIQKEEEQMS
ncbi:hypothetical protein M9435_003823 [Picochlorum sp. BPE23]|nr:hypothetical protein M9435_003823 [Picochlorum sp. BPE23]